MNPILINTFFRQGSGAAFLLPPTREAYVNIRILGKNRDFLPLSEAFVIELEGLKNAAGAYLNSVSTITATVQTIDPEADLVTPVTMSYVASSNGTYRATMPHTLAMEQGTAYKVVVDDPDTNSVHMERTMFCQPHAG